MSGRTTSGPSPEAAPLIGPQHRPRNDLPSYPVRDRPSATPAYRRMTPLQIYLPIADLPVNVFLVFGMGIAVGFISGMFGIGGGFLMTPLLIFVGISPAVAVASVASHI